MGVAYGSDTELVRRTLLAVPMSHSQVLSEPKPEVRFEGFGDSSLDFSLLVWISDPGEDRRISSDLRFDIERSFRAAGIEIPFPQRDLHVRSPPSEGGTGARERSAERSPARDR